MNPFHINCWSIISCNASLPDFQSFYRLGTVWFSQTNQGVQICWVWAERSLFLPSSSCSPLTNDSPASNRGGPELRLIRQWWDDLYGVRMQQLHLHLLQQSNLKEQGLCIPVASARILTLSLLILAFPTQEIWSRCSSKFSATLGKSSVNLLSVTS